MRFVPIRQLLVSCPLADIAAEVRRQLDHLPLDVPQGEVALTLGSRGIANMALVARTAGEWLRERGAQPFAVPAMGSHNGATAAGQQAMLESLGCDAAALGMPIRSSMQTVVVGEVDGDQVHIDRLASESAGVLAINRVKLHTSFDGRLGSGLAKMLAVGLGKLGGAETFHRASFHNRAARLESMAQMVLATGKIWAGLAILEDGNDLTCELHAIAAKDILAMEPTLLKRHRELFPRLPVDQLKVLVVETIGKNFSGTGMDTNIIGRRGLGAGFDPPTPRIDTVAALSLSPASQGNAIGVGLADAITRRLFDAIDMEKTLVNTRATGAMQRAEIHQIFETDEQLCEALAQLHGTNGWMIIPNTLHLERLLASPDVAAALVGHDRCQQGEPLDLTFKNGQLQAF